MDTNHISAWERRDPRFLANLRKKPVENLIWVCPISLGEIETGLRIGSPADTDKHRACRRFVDEEVLQFVWEIRVTTRESYAEVMERLWRRHPNASKLRTQEHLSRLGVDVNDVWIVAVAIEHGLILLTDDKLEAIRECVPELKIENWLD